MSFFRRRKHYLGKGRFVENYERVATDLPESETFYSDEHGQRLSLPRRTQEYLGVGALVEADIERIFGGVKKE